MVKTKKPARVADVSSSAAKEYNPYLDVLKGFTILLVVLGHSLQSFVPKGAFDQNILFRIIYSFHMPLFMFLAGAAGAYSLRPMNWKFLQRKFYMLVIPFAAWAILDYFLDSTYQQELFKTYIHKLILSPDYGLWFLWILFLNFCALALIKQLQRWFKLYAYLIVWLVIYALPTGSYGIGLMKWHLPFFLIGYLIYFYRDSLAKYRKPVLILCAVTAPLLVASWHRLYYPSFVVKLSPRLVGHGLQTITIGNISSIDTYSVFVLAYTYLVPLSMIGLVYWLLQLRPSTKLWKFFGFFGLYTLDIYVMSFSFLKYSFGGPWMRVVSGFVIATALSLAIGIFILRRVPILSTIFLGGRSTPKALTLKQKPAK